MAVLPQITSKIFLYLLLCSAILATTFQGALCDTDVEGPSESECRPYIEKALKKLETGDTPEVAQEDVNLVVTENEDDSNGPPIGDVIETDDNEAALNLDEEQADQPESTQEDTESLETEGEPTENVAEETVDEQTETEKSEEQPISKECDSETGCATETASEENKEEDQTIETLSDENETTEDDQGSTEAVQEAEASVEQSASEEEVVEQAGSTEAQADASEAQASLEQDASSTEAVNASQEDASEQEQSDSDKQVSAENVSAKDENSAEDSVASEQDNASVEGAVTGEASQEETQENASIQESGENTAEQTDDSAQSVEQTEDAAQSVEQIDEAAQSVEQTEETAEAQSEEQTEETVEAQSAEQTEETVEAQSLEQTEESAQLVEQVEESASSVEQTEDSTQSVEQTEEATQSSEQTEEVAQSAEQADESTQSIEQTEETAQSIEDATASVEQSEEATQSAERTEEAASSVEQTEAGSSVEQTETAEVQSAEQTEAAQSVEQTEEVAQSVEETEGEAQSESTEVQEEVQSEEKPVIVIEDLTFEFDIPTNLRPRDHVTEILQIDEGSNESELINIKAEESTLKELKRLYENAIKPLEVLYKYRDLSNRHFGDPEIYSKPLVLFMGPWSGGKSSIINYLLDNEYTDTSLRTGAEPSPAYFNIITHGEKTEVLDGTQLAADWTFSGLQKFGQGLEERLRGLKMPKKLLEKINIVEIPGILEVRKQVSRIFPFNDVCQWFIDRADIIFLVYDPSKLDVGPETEAILDQLKGREYQTRIILNKADQVKPEELMRVQGALIWNISPLMSSAQPPVMYSTSLWSRPYEIGAPIRLLEAQERAFLKDLKNAMDRRVENKIASARRFAVRVRNHAKMVDCYLTTYYNHKSVFGNRKLVSDQIIEHPQEYHIYEGLSTLTNISRYDLPDPDVYRDFFKLNPLYDFQQLSATCTYFRGCPINRLDISIAYDLPELVGKYKKMTENTLDSMKATLKS